MTVTRTPARTRTGPPAPVRPDRSVLATTVVLTVVSLGGSAYAVASGLTREWWDAVGPTGRLSVPLPMNAALLVAAAITASPRRLPSLAAGALLLIASIVCVVSGFFDGGYGADLSAAQRLWQLALVAALVGTGALAARLIVRRW